MRHFFLSIFFLWLYQPDTFSQSSSLIIGSIESNIDYDTNVVFFLNKVNPYVGILHFYKESNIWHESNMWDSLNFKKYENIGNVNFFSKGKKLSKNVLTLDTSMYRRPFHDFPYHLSNPNFAQVGRKSTKYSLEGDFKIYSPQLFSNATHFRRNQSPKYQKASAKDGTLISQYLIKLAEEKKLGDILRKKIIIKGYPTLIINDSCRIVTFDIKLNMYCYDKNVPFDYKEELDTNGDLLWTSESQQATAQYGETPKFSFLISGKQISLLSTNLEYFDNTDFDNDGYDEIFFRQEDGDNYTGYVMITDKFKNALYSGWSYH
jgi:hypothetical protein